MAEEHQQQRLVGSRELDKHVVSRGAISADPPGCPECGLHPKISPHPKAKCPMAISLPAPGVSGYISGYRVLPSAKGNPLGTDTGKHCRQTTHGMPRGGAWSRRG